MKPTPIHLADIRQNWNDAATAQERKAIILSACATFDCAYSTMTRKLGLNARKRSLSKAEAERKTQHEDYARKVFAFRYKADYGQKSFTIKQAYDCLVDDGQVPAEIPLKTIYNSAWQIGLINEYASISGKFSGPRAPLKLVLIDYSKSDYFRLKKDRVVMERPAVKKKEQPRLMIAAAVDYYSRVCWCKYYTVSGESAEFVRNVLLDVFDGKQNMDYTTGEFYGTAKLLQGIPKAIYVDRGSGNKDNREIQSGLARLQVHRILGMNERDSLGRTTNRSNKKARGVIEKFIGDFKRNFEGRIWGRMQLGNEPETFSLSELNERVLEYCKEVNSKPHPVIAQTDRWSLFAPVVDSLRFPPSNAKMFFGGWLPRVVQHRLIMGRSKQEWFVAPQAIYNGATVDVLLVGSEAFLFLNNQLLKLRPQPGSRDNRRAVESLTTSYYDTELKERLADELAEQSDDQITLRSLGDDFADDVAEFIERPRTVTEIKERASYFITAKRNQKRKGNIIRL